MLGAIALLIPGLRRIKDWAYAGIFFEMTGAAASHAFVGDYGAYAYHIFTTLCFAALTLVSWALRPKAANFKEVMKVDILKTRYNDHIRRNEGIAVFTCSSAQGRNTLRTPNVLLWR
ncbi:MAG: rane protein [Paenibacillus sp.]|nr:rane protein [Paenibacillus sp.]